MIYARMVVFDSSDAIKAFVEVGQHSPCITPTIQFLLADARSKEPISWICVPHWTLQEDPKVPAIIGYFDKDLHAHEKDVFEDVRNHCDVMQTHITFFVPLFIFNMHRLADHQYDCCTTPQVADLEFGNYKIAHTTNKQVLKEAGVNGFAIYVYKPVRTTRKRCSVSSWKR